MKRLFLAGLAVFALLRFTERGRRAREVYASEVASGSRPIDAVGTAVAAFVGLAPGGPVNARENDPDAAPRVSEPGE